LRIESSLGVGGEGIVRGVEEEGWSGRWRGIEVRKAIRASKER